MKKCIIICFCLCFCFLIYANQNEQESNRIPFPAGIVLDGAAAVQTQFDILDSPYYPRHDFFNMKSSESLILLERFKTFQQTTEFTCGPATIVMLLHHYGINYEHGDRLLYEMRANHARPESTLKDLITMLESTGNWEIMSTFDLEDPAHLPPTLLIDSLKEGKPIIIGDDDWGGHWRIIIGFDDMGDDIEANDVFILADPYDTTDHFQDGYNIIPAQRLYYNWRNNYDPDFTHNLFLIAYPKDNDE